MRITRRQLIRIIREAGRSEHGAEASGMLKSYNAGYRDAFRSPGRKRVGPNREYKRGYEKGLEDAKRGIRPPDDDNPGRGRMREADGSTKKYDDDSALKGGQSKLPDGLQKGIIDKTVEDREDREEEEKEEKNESLRITKRQLKRIIKESLLAEGEMQDIIVNSYEDVDDYNILANFALAGDIAGALAHPDIKHYVDKNEMGWVADEAGGWFEKVGDWEEMPAPEGWDRDEAYQFLTDLENAAWKVYDKQASAAINNDPDKEFLEFLGNQWTSMIEPNDMEGIKWKEYKKYIRLKPPPSISHGVGEIHITKEDTENLYPGAYEDFKDFLTTRAGGQLGKRKPYKKSPPPYYD